MDTELHRRCANTIKGLAMDAVQRANSGHPGMPMGMADAATVLWTGFLKFDPSAPDWFDRDRFVLSAGHGSMLLYSLLHLSGFDLSLDELRDFRTWGSRTPGHPEVGHTPGVEMTTGPLGQGIATAVGMAFAERMMRETFGPELCDHHTYGICSDGDLMEGISAEACSLAGHLALGRIVFLYDDNEITIDGGTELSFTEDPMKRLAAQGWHVQRVDGHEPAAVRAAIEAARAVTDKPSMIACRTVIGQGSPSYEGTSRTHGAALGEDEVRATKQAIGLDPDAHFAVPDDVREAFTGNGDRAAHTAWRERLAAHPEGARFQTWLDADPETLIARVDWPEFQVGTKLATRKASKACLQAIVARAPWLVGGSADLAGSNGTAIGAQAITAERFAGAGTVHFGVREHAMAALCNGIALHGGLRAYDATFLMFHDYMRPAVRLGALMKMPVVHIYTHDSVFLGEDGPTHQPISTLLALRAIPNVDVWRPGDAAETIEAWKAALRKTDGPSALILTRQGLPVLDHTELADPGGAARGGYVLSDCEGDAQVCLLGTGSEVATCLDAQQVLAAQGIRSRVVSLPCRERFWAQDSDYKHGVLPMGVPRLSVEAGVTLGWERWVGDNGDCIGIDDFGHSAPASVIAENLGFTSAHVAERAAALL